MKVLVKTLLSAGVVHKENIILYQISNYPVKNDIIIYYIFICEIKSS